MSSPASDAIAPKRLFSSHSSEAPPSLRKQSLIALGLFAIIAALYFPWQPRPLHNGDEVVYAEFAREMSDGGDWLTAHWQGEPQLNRAPAAIWPLALAAKLFGPTERALLGVVALESALAVVLTFFLGARRYGLLGGLAGALACALSDRFFVYASYIESEPLLVLFTVAAVLCWELARDRPRWLYGFGAALAAAMLTKQLVGMLPLFLPALDLVTGRRFDRRRLLSALALAFALALPWHLIAWLRFGHRFLDAYFLEQIGVRARSAMHAHPTSRLYYFKMFWSREGLLALLPALGLIHLGTRREWLLPAWVLGALLPLSLAATRFDYYALIAYPALGLAAGQLAARVVPRLGPWLAAALVGAYALYNVPVDRNSGLVWDLQMRALSEAAGSASRADETIYVIDQFAYATRFYSGRRSVKISLGNEGDDPGGVLLPGPIVGRAALAKLGGDASSRWFAIAPKRDAPELDPLGKIFVLTETRDYFLMSNRPEGQR